MSPADLYRMVKNCDGAVELEDFGLKVWKIGDRVQVDGVAVELTELVVVQDPKEPKHGRVVMFGHATGDPNTVINGSFPILFSSALRQKV